MPYKPPMPDEDINALAAELKPLWRTGRPMRPWLRKHGHRLIALMQDEWTWDSLGQALTRAGITYRTGHPWTGEHLRSQVTRATAPLKGRKRAASGPKPPGHGKPARARDSRHAANAPAAGTTTAGRSQALISAPPPR